MKGYFLKILFKFILKRVNYRSARPFSSKIVFLILVMEASRISNNLEENLSISLYEFIITYWWIKRWVVGGWWGRRVRQEVPVSAFWCGCFCGRCDWWIYWIWWCFQDHWRMSRCVCWQIGKPQKTPIRVTLLF